MHGVTHQVVGRRTREFGREVSELMKDTMFVFEMPKVVHIHKPSLAVLYRITQLLILTYFVIYVMWLNRGYQSTERAISGVTAKLKGIAWMHIHPRGMEDIKGPVVLDDSEYLLQPVQNSGFYLITRILSMTRQNLDVCPESNHHADARCFKHQHCPVGEQAGFSIQGQDGCMISEEEINIEEYGHGVFTGKCDNGSETCEVFAWCPIVQVNDVHEISKTPVAHMQMVTPPNILQNPYAYFDDLNFIDSRRRLIEFYPGSVDPIFEVVNFTVLIKNSIEFPNFKVKRRNILPHMTQNYIKSCLYDPNDSQNRFCPKFRIGDIIKYAGSDEQVLLRFGGVIAITIQWDCDLDWSLDYCVPTYQFHQLDHIESTQNKDILYLSDGSVVENSDHYGHDDEFGQRRRRILTQVNGIQFLIRVTGQAGKFNLLSFTMRFGSGLALLSIAQIFNDIILFHFTHDRKKYRQATCDNKTLKRLLSIAASAHLPQSRRSQMLQKYSKQFLPKDKTSRNERLNLSSTINQNTGKPPTRTMIPQIKVLGDNGSGISEVFQNKSSLFRSKNTNSCLLESNSRRNSAGTSQNSESASIYSTLLNYPPKLSVTVDPPTYVSNTSN